MYDTGYVPKHKCGRVLDYCLIHNTRIYFCIFCKKVIGTQKELSEETLLDNI